MKTKLGKREMIPGIIAVTLCFSGMALADKKTASKPSSEPKTAEKQSAEVKSVKKKVNKESQKITSSKKDDIIKEAVQAVASTRDALAALESGKHDAALKSLETALGKLELILARNPDLELVPVNVVSESYDLYANSDTIRAATKEAREALDKGRVQAARHLLKNLASEVVIRTVSIPLGTYPKALKLAVPLVDAKKTVLAEIAIQEMLSTLVVTEEIVPLPMLRVEKLLDVAKGLAETKDRSKTQTQACRNMLDQANEQLEISELLGYGDKSTYAPFHREIDGIKKKLKNGDSGSGWFDKIKSLVDDLKPKVDTSKTKSEKKKKDQKVNR